MVSMINVDDRLASLGFDANQTYDVPENPADAALLSVNAFIREHAIEEPSESLGIVHVTGPAIAGNSAPVRSVGNFLTSFQGVFDAIGAALTGNRSSGGPIPATVSGRTEMSLVASPTPGSIILQIAPTISRIDDLHPMGKPLFEVDEEMGVKPLADQTFGELSLLMQSLQASEKADDDAFIERLSNLGPRAASAMRVFCESVGKGGLDVELEWTEPNAKSEIASITYLDAKRAVKTIEDANIDFEEVVIEGTIVTVTQSHKDKLRVVEDDGRDNVIAVGSISPAETYALHPGERVRVVAERRTSRKPGGKTNVKLVGVSVEVVAPLSL